MRTCQSRKSWKMRTSQRHVGSPAFSSLPLCIMSVYKRVQDASVFARSE